MPLIKWKGNTITSGNGLEVGVSIRVAGKFAAVKGQKENIIFVGKAKEGGRNDGDDGRALLTLDSSNSVLLSVVMVWRMLLHLLNIPNTRAPPLAPVSTPYIDTSSRNQTPL